jgi:hypothetical protein
MEASPGQTILLLAGSALLVAAFALIESRRFVPLRFLRSRTLRGASAVMLLNGTLAVARRRRARIRTRLRAQQHRRPASAPRSASPLPPRSPSPAPNYLAANEGASPLAVLNEGFQSASSPSSCLCPGAPAPRPPAESATGAA